MAKQTKKPDIRVQLTRKILQESLIGLMENKPVLQISIKEICERAGVSRTTFYAYYQDQFDLLRQIEKQSLMDTAAVMQKNKYTEKLSRQEIINLFQDILQLIADNRNSIQVLLGENGDIGYQKRLMRKALEWTQVWGARIDDMPGIKAAEYYSVFWVGGVHSFLQKWITNGMDTPGPLMAKMLAKLTAGIR
jgi:AcrR family transcriptional regulator